MLCNLVCVCGSEVNLKTSDTGEASTEKHTNRVNALPIPKGQDHRGTVIAEPLVPAAWLQDRPCPRGRCPNLGIE